MCVISDQVNRLHHRGGQPPKPNPVLRAVIAAHLLQTHMFGVDTITKATVVGNVSRPLVDAALVVLQSGSPGLLAAVLSGREPLARAAASVRSSVRLIEAFKNATPDDLILLNHAVGGRVVVVEPEMFDRLNAPQHHEAAE